MDFNKKTEELKRICEPAIRYLKEHCNPHTKLVISTDFIKVVIDEIGIPLENKTTNED